MRMSKSCLTSDVAGKNIVYAFQKGIHLLFLEDSPLTLKKIHPTFSNKMYSVNEYCKMSVPKTFAVQIPQQITLK